MKQPHVQVVLGEDRVPPTLEAALRRTRASVSFRQMNDALRPGSTLNADAVVIVASNPEQLSDRMKLLFDRIADRPRATLVLHEGERDPRWELHPESLPVCFANNPSEQTIAVQLETMLDMRHSLEALHRGSIANDANQKNMSLRYKEQLRLASKVQRELLPQELPRFGAISFSAIYRPAEYVSGDTYDIQRLDEEHVGIAVADSTGDGIPAALLTVFVKRALRGKDVVDGRYRVLPPDEVLARLNAEILDANLSECRFVAVSYALLNIRTREVAIARGGSPFPILRRADGSTQLIRAFGGVVGVLPEANFVAEKLHMGRGDSLVLYSDGVEHLITPAAGLAGLADAFARTAAESRPTGPTLAPSISGANVGTARAARDDAGSDAPRATPAGRSSPDELIVTTSWFTTLRERGVPAAMSEFSTRYNALRRIGQKMDDVTMLALHVDE